MTEPVPPTNVRAVLDDGTEVPLDCVYEGMVEGLHRWRATWALPDRPREIRASVLPSRTSIAIAWAEL